MKSISHHFWLNFASWYANAPGHRHVQAQHIYVSAPVWWHMLTPGRGHSAIGFYYRTASHWGLQGSRSWLPWKGPLWSCPHGALRAVIIVTYSFLHLGVTLSPSTVHIPWSSKGNQFHPAACTGASKIRMCLKTGSRLWWKVRVESKGHEYIIEFHLEPKYPLCL